MSDEKKQVAFTVREEYIRVDKDGLFCREVKIEGTVSEDRVGNNVYDLVRLDTGEKIYPFQLKGLTLLGDRTYIVISGYGQGWGKGESIEIALTNMMQASGMTKAKAKRLEILRAVTVLECVEGSGYVTGMGGAGGLMLKRVKSGIWMDTLWNLVKPKK